MTKADLVSKIYDKVGLSKKESTVIVELIFEIIRTALENRNKV
jgi:integration host factor subunit alpha